MQFIIYDESDIYLTSSYNIEPVDNDIYYNCTEDPLYDIKVKYI
jgi:hypothetical protein